MTLGEFVKGFRERMNWSQREFARQTGLSNTYISLLEKGGINPKTGEPITPDMATLRSIASVTGESVHSLLSQVDDFYIDISSDATINPALTLKEPSTQFNVEELEIVNIWNTLSEDGKQYLLQQAKIAQQVYGGKDEK